jgi:hypothetical protein
MFLGLGGWTVGLGNQRIIPFERSPKSSEATDVRHEVMKSIMSEDETGYGYDVSDLFSLPRSVMANWVYSDSGLSVEDSDSIPEHQQNPDPPVTFQSCTEEVLEDRKWTICLCYFDDITIFCSSF